MAKVTKIEQQKKNPNRWSIYIDNRFFASCSEEALAALKIRERDDLMVHQMDELRDALGLTKVRESALKYLGLRTRSESEMRKYLQRKGFDSSQIDSTIIWLKDRKFIDDTQFAEDWVQGRQQTAPRGKRRLMLELYQKGIDRETATHAVSEGISKEEEADAAYQALQSRKNRYRGMEALDIRKKIYTFLSYRGFSPDAVASAWERLKREMNLSGEDPTE